jgi:hypothetical protein
MKGIIILALVLMAGCGTFTPLEQLEEAALLTGDWSAVEQRERIMARSQFWAGPQCQGEQIHFCHTSGASTNCECVEPRVARSFVDGR